MELPKSWKASFESLDLKVGRVSTPAGIIVDSIEIVAKEAAYESDPQKFGLKEPALFKGIVLEGDLKKFVCERTPEGIEIDSIKLLPGKIVVEAAVSMIIRVGGTAECSLHVEDQRRLVIRADSVDVMGGSMKSLVQKQLDGMNPLLDVSELPFDIRLHAVEIEAGRIVLGGTLAP